ncbi:MAG: MlaD family protein [Phycisphaerae bacterium]
MNEFRRNVIVGIFVMGGLAAVGIMIILFGQAPKLWAKGYVVSMFFTSAGPVGNGDPVYINGRQIGEVKWVELRPDPREGVKIVCRINEEIRISDDATPLIKEQSMGFGKPAIQIEEGPENSPKTLPTDGTGILKGSVAGGIAEVIPKSIMTKLENASVALTNLATALTPVADDLHVLFKPQSLTEMKPSTGPAARPLANISTAIQRFDMALKNFNDVVANPANKHNLTAMLNNFNKVSAGLIANTDKLSQLFDKLNQAAEKMSSGQGAAGKFLNNPELYDALTDTAKKLQLAADDLRTLLTQWQENGLKIQGGILGK